MSTRSLTKVQSERFMAILVSLHRVLRPPTLPQHTVLSPAGAGKGIIPITTRAHPCSAGTDSSLETEMNYLQTKAKHFRAGEPEEGHEQRDNIN